MERAQLDAAQPVRDQLGGDTRHALVVGENERRRRRVHRANGTGLCGSNTRRSPDGA
jgi:hypothetical protein